MVTQRVKCKVCGKEIITRYNRFRCCKLLQSSEKCIIANGEEVKKREIKKNEVKEIQKKQEIDKKTDIQPQKEQEIAEKFVEEELNLECE